MKTKNWANNRRDIAQFTNHYLPIQATNIRLGQRVKGRRLSIIVPLNQAFKVRDLEDLIQRGLLNNVVAKK